MKPWHSLESKPSLKYFVNAGSKESNVAWTSQPL